VKVHQDTSSEPGLDKSLSVMIQVGEDEVLKFSKVASTDYSVEFVMMYFSREKQRTPGFSTVQIKEHRN